MILPVNPVQPGSLDRAIYPRVNRNRQLQGMQLPA
jgi:hypothetical protein